jgi:hypothetical protein
VRSFGVRGTLIASVATAIVALLAFGAVHALWLVPIWDRLAGGLPFTLVGAATMGWLYVELRAGSVLALRPALAGVALGAGIWGALLPATLFCAYTRYTGWRATHSDAETAAEVVIAAATGFVFALVLGLRSRGRIAGALAVTVMLMVQAGPLQILASPRALGMLFWLAGIYVACGVLLAYLMEWLSYDPLGEME